MSPDLNIVEADAPNGIGVLRLTGRLEARAAQDLLRRCRELKTGGRARIVLNLAGVTFVASSGIGTLLALTEELKESGGSMEIAAPSEAVSSVVDLLNLTEFLAIHDTESKAMKTPEELRVKARADRQARA
jgi:anti-sigma B factor antagonist